MASQQALRTLTTGGSTALGSTGSTTTSSESDLRAVVEALSDYVMTLRAYNEALQYLVLTNDGILSEVLPLSDIINEMSLS